MFSLPLIPLSSISRLYTQKIDLGKLRTSPMHVKGRCIWVSLKETKQHKIKAYSFQIVLVSARLNGRYDRSERILSRPFCSPGYAVVDLRPTILFARRTSARHGRKKISHTPDTFA